MTEGEACVGDGRVVNNRHEPCRIRHERAVEERLVAVRETDQIDVALEITRFGVEVLHYTLELSIEAFH